MKKAEDFRQMLGPVDSGFHTVFHKTLEDLQQESRRKPARKRTALYPLRIRIAAAAAALALLAGEADWIRRTRSGAKTGILPRPLRQPWRREANRKQRAEPPGRRSSRPGPTSSIRKRLWSGCPGCSCPMHVPCRTGGWCCPVWKQNIWMI